MKMKPVFSDKERDTERDVDVTTVSKVVETKETPIPNMVTKEEAENIARQYADQAASRASEQAVNVALERYDNRRKEEDDRRRREEEERDKDSRKKRRDEDEDAGQAISTKTVNELKNIASVFNALKEFSANPLQKKIEESVGGFAAGVVERAFSPPHQEQKKDFIDQILNSNFASGLGAGLGQRGPELVDVFTKNFGKEKVDGWITGAVKGGGSGGGIGGLGGIPGISSPGVSPGKQQSEMEMVLSLDSNNPEHVAAYAASQGGISVETARKILTIHQDDFIKQMQLKGGNVGSNVQGQGQEYNIQKVDNVQEYRRPLPRINEDLMVNTPITEDKKWDREDEKTDAYVNSLDMQNLGTQNLGTQNLGTGSRPEIESIESIQHTSSNPGSDNSNIMTYLIELKDMIEKQGNEMFNLKHELDIIKKDRLSPDDIIKDRNIKEEKIKEEKIKEENSGSQTTKNDNHVTTVSSMKTIKKGYNYIKQDVQDSKEV